MQTIHIYSDESRHKGERFFLLGGIWVREEDVAKVERDIENLRIKHAYTNDSGEQIPFRGEFKWTKVSDKYLQVYKDVIDLFFDWIEADTVRFCTMLVDKENQNIKKHNNLDGEGFYKLYYQLYYQNSRIPALYRIFPDRIRNKDHRNIKFETLHKCLNSSLFNKFQEKVSPEQINDLLNIVREITPVDSKKTQVIQVVDILLGGLGFFQNRHFEKDGARKSKIELMKYINDKLIYSGVIRFTGKKYLVARSTKFNIWLFRPKK